MILFECAFSKQITFNISFLPTHELKKPSFVDVRKIGNVIPRNLAFSSKKQKEQPLPVSDCLSIERFSFECL